MNKITELKQRAGIYTDVSGRWVHEADLEKFTKFIIDECCDRLSKETIRHDGYGYNQFELYSRLREHFGVQE